MHKPEVYRQFVIDQYKRIKNMIEQGNKPEMRKNLRNYEIVVENFYKAYIRKQNMDTQAMCKKAEKEVLQDIRMYFESG